MKAKEEKQEKKALEKLVIDNFCGKQSIVGCPYYEKVWCKKNCGFYSKMINDVKYWNR
jgi:hypothetical protein